MLPSQCSRAGCNPDPHPPNLTFPARTALRSPLPCLDLARPQQLRTPAQPSLHPGAGGHHSGCWGHCSEQSRPSPHAPGAPDGNLDGEDLRFKGSEAMTKWAQSGCLLRRQTLTRRAGTSHPELAPKCDFTTREYKCLQQGVDGICFTRVSEMLVWWVSKCVLNCIK